MMCMSESTNRRPSFMSSSCGVTERAGSPLGSAVVRTIAGSCAESSAACLHLRVHAGLPRQLHTPAGPWDPSLLLRQPRPDHVAGVPAADLVARGDVWLGERGAKGGVRRRPADEAALRAH